MTLSVSSPAELSSLPGFKRALQIQRRMATQADEGYRTPLFSGLEPEEVVSQWSAKLSGTYYDEIEKKEKTKVGPFYHAPFEEWEEKVRSYFNHSSLDFSLEPTGDEELERAISWEVDRLTSLLNRGTLIPLTISEAFAQSTKGTNLGLPDVSSNWNEANVGYYLRRASQIVEGKETTLYPFVLFQRSQPRGRLERKDWHTCMRGVWGADHAETFAALTVLKAFVNAFRNKQGFEHLLGIDPLENAMIKNLPNKYAISLDLSSADATFGPRLFLIGFRILNIIFPDIPVKMWETLYVYYTSGPLLTPTGLWKGIHGMPSGVGLTNLLETIVFPIIARIAAERQGVTLEPKQVWQNGDDGLYLTTSQLDVGRMAETYSEFGLVLSTTKTTASRSEASYLQRHFLERGGHLAVMSTNRMLGRILYAERGVDPVRLGMTVKQYWLLNTIAKLENCKRHPRFGKYVDFVRRGDKFNLDLSELKGSFTVENYAVVGDGALDQSGLEQFETVKYLRRNASPGSLRQMRVNQRTLPDEGAAINDRNAVSSES